MAASDKTSASPRFSDEFADALAALVADDGRTLDELTATEAVDLADRLRAIVAALDAPTPRDRRLAADLVAAAAVVERHAGVGAA